VARIAEIIWTRGAADDLQELFTAMEAREPGSGERYCDVVNGALELLRAFPARAPMAQGSARLRRLLIGTHRECGLFYAAIGGRIVVAAVIDLRQDPAKIAEMLKARS
jgi:plasmid stabilization system protein ParE